MLAKSDHSLKQCFPNVSQYHLSVFIYMCIYVSYAIVYLLFLSLFFSLFKP